MGSCEWKFPSEEMMGWQNCYVELTKWLGNSLESGTSVPCPKMSAPDTVINVLVHPNVMLGLPKRSWHSWCFPWQRGVLSEDEMLFYAHMKCQCWVTKVCVTMSSACCPLPGLRTFLTRTSVTQEQWDVAPVLPLLSGGCVPQAYRAPKADRNPAFH